MFVHFDPRKWHFSFNNAEQTGQKEILSFAWEPCIFDNTSKSSLVAARSPINTPSRKLWRIPLPTLSFPRFKQNQNRKWFQKEAFWRFQKLEKRNEWNYACSELSVSVHLWVKINIFFHKKILVRLFLRKISISNFYQKRNFLRFCNSM